VADEAYTLSRSSVFVSLREPLRAFILTVNDDDDDDDDDDDIYCKRPHISRYLRNDAS